MILAQTTSASIIKGVSGTVNIDYKVQKSLKKLQFHASYLLKNFSTVVKKEMNFFIKKDLQMDLSDI